jgi:hypothetical protein
MQSLSNLISKVRDFLDRVRSNKTISRVLIPLSFLYPVILIILSWSELIEINWGAFVGDIYYVIFLYFSSLLVQGMGWSVILNGSFSHFFSDMEIFFKSMLMRRLPGGFWHWIGRSNLYEGVEFKPQRGVGLANWTEWLFLILSGVTIYFLCTKLIYGGIAFAISYVIIFFLINKTSKNNTAAIFYALLVILIYLVSWLFGGIILHALIKNIFQNVLISFSKSVSVWAITGTISTISFFVPSGVFIRELSLIALLENYLNYSEVILLGLVIRIIFLICDIVLSLFGMIFFRWLGRVFK